MDKLIKSDNLTKIELDEQDYDYINKIKPAFFITDRNLLKKYLIKVSKDEVLSEEGRKKIQGDVLEIQLPSD